MFSDKYKKDNEKIKLDDSFKVNLKNNLKKGDNIMVKSNKKLKVIVGLAAVTALLIGGSLFANKAGVDLDGKIAGNEQVEDLDTKGGSSEGNIGSTSMAEFLHYNGKIYNFVANNVKIESIDEIKGEKLGVTKLGDEKENLTSFIAGQEIYKLKGYDDSVLMGISTVENEKTIHIYQSYDSKIIKNGADLLDIFKIEGNVKSINSILGTGELNNTNNGYIETLFSEIKKAKNINEDNELMKDFYIKNKNVKGIQITLTDGIMRTFDIYETGYVFIDGYIFDIENKGLVKEIYDKL
ncbi:MAG: hypothetical protein ACRC41_08150 [Sarcina sp.]